MPMFRKKPVVIDAIQWTGNNLPEVFAFTGKHPKWDLWFDDWKAYEAYVKANDDTFKILTLEGTMTATPGDWIVRGVKGEHYPCKPDIFSATYEPADLCAPAQSRTDQESPDPMADPRVNALVEALEQLLPQNLGPASCLTDSAVIPVDMTMGEIRKSRAALAALKGGA